MINEILYKVDKQLRPKRRFFDNLEHNDKLEPRKKEILEFIKIKLREHNKDFFSGRADGIETIRNLNSSKKYNLISDFYLNESKNNPGNLESYNLSRKLRAKAVHEKLKDGRFSDAFSYAKQYKILESEIIKETLIEIDKRINQLEEKVNKIIPTNELKAKKLVNQTSSLLSFNGDYAKANNYLNISSQLKERYDTLNTKYKINDLKDNL